jgi:hypothetical protein
MSTSPNPLASIGSFLTGLSTDIATTYTAINAPPSLTKPAVAPSGTGSTSSTGLLSPAKISTTLWIAAAAVILVIIVMYAAGRKGHRR